MERESKGTYRLSKEGLILVDPRSTEEQKIKIVIKVLLTFHESIMIGISSESEMDREKLSKILIVCLGRNWNPYTADRYTLRFLSFLKYAKLVEGKGKNFNMLVTLCSSCNYPISRESQFCPNCGQKKRKERWLNVQIAMKFSRSI